MGGMIDLSYLEISSTLEVHCCLQRLTVAEVQLLSAGKDLQIILTGTVASKGFPHSRLFIGYGM